MHISEVIRNAAVTTLIGQTTAEDRVFNSRILNFKEGDIKFPVINVSDDGDEMEVNPLTSNSSERHMDLVIQVYVSTNDTYAIELDTIREAIEELFLKESLNIPFRHTIQYKKTTKMFSDSNVKDFAMAEIYYLVTVYTFK